MLKKQGQVYTPLFIVQLILTMSGYCGKSILDKHVIDNSCGNGAFLKEIVKIYCEEAIKEKLSKEEIRNNLSFFIHGIEINETAYTECICNLNALTELYGIYDVKWDILCDDALTVSRYNNKMDFVIGNPPYIRIHNIENPCYIKNFSFTQNGMTDIYIAFFEIGINMLKSGGTLGYITPSSFFNSIAAKKMRQYFVRNNLLKKLLDFRHFQSFDATTYTAITILQKNTTNTHIDYYHFNEDTHSPIFIDTLTSSDYYIAGNFYFSKVQNLKILKQIKLNTSKSDICVKNGYATLCDSVFINDFSFKSQYIIPAIKSSTGKLKRIFFPYDKYSKLIPEKELQEDVLMYNYLHENKEKLLNRSNEKDPQRFWYAFGRSQAIADTYKAKLAVNTLVRTKNDLKFSDAPAGVGVYGGLYIISPTVNYNSIKNVLNNDEFITYVSLLGKYKSGGYFTFSSKELKEFLDYKFSYQGGLFSC